MPGVDLIPRQDGKRGNWAQTLKTQIALQGAALGLTAAEITEFENACQQITDSIQEFNAARSTYKTASANKKTKMRNALAVIRKKTRRMKTHEAYNKSVGKSLGLEAPLHIVDIKNKMPILKLRKEVNGIRISYNRLGTFDGINIYRKRPSDADFILLARDNHSPYIDKTTIETGTEYYAYYMKGDDEVGQKSNEAVV